MLLWLFDLYMDEGNEKGECKVYGLRGEVKA